MEKTLGRGKFDNMDIPSSFIITKMPAKLINTALGTTDMTGSIGTTTRTRQTKERNDTISTGSIQ